MLCIMAERTRSSSPGIGKIFFSNPKCSYRFYPGNKSGINLATHLLLVPTLGMSGAIPLLPLCAYIVLAVTTFNFYPCNQVVLKMMTRVAEGSLGAG